MCGLLIKSYTKSVRAKCFRYGVSQSLRSPWPTTTIRPLHCSGLVGIKGDNPLLKTSGLPLFNEIKPVHVQPAIDHALEELDSGFRELEASFGVADNNLTYANVVEAMELLSAPLQNSWGIVNHLISVKNSEDLRTAHEKMNPKVVKLLQKISQSVPYYEALKKLRRNAFKLDKVQMRIVEKSIQSMEQSGIGLEESKRSRFNELQVKISELKRAFAANVLDAKKAFSLVLTDKSEVDGIPVTLLPIFAKNAVDRGHTNATTENGPWVVTLDAPSFIPFMKFAHSESLREKVYRAYVSSAGSDPFDNRPLIDEFLKIRSEMANILGFRSHADKVFENRMATSPDAVMELIDSVSAKALPLALQELDDMNKFAEKQTGRASLKHSELMYWAEKLKESRFQLTEEELRPYFSLDSVLEGLFGFINKMFGVTVKLATKKTSVWHQDVLFYNIFQGNSSDDSEPIASFYLDPFARPEEKQGGAWMNTCLGKSRALNQNRPVAYLVCNGSPPTNETPSLMSFQDCETLWHEAGHGLQHMLTEVEHGDAAGINLVEWDAVELPSQWMEEWLYDKDTLLSFAKHYKTQQPLPDELFQKLVASRHYNAGMSMSRQLNYSVVDLMLHARPDEVEKYGPKNIRLQTAEKYDVLSPHQDDNFLCGFQHIFSGGYSAGYYSYLYSRVLSTDAFEAFEEVGLHNKEAISHMGKKFRSTILAQGGGTDPAEVFREFRGRNPKPDALLRLSGLAS